MKVTELAGRARAASTAEASLKETAEPGGHQPGMLLDSFFRPPSQHGPQTARTVRAGTTPVGGEEEEGRDADASAKKWARRGVSEAKEEGRYVDRRTRDSGSADASPRRVDQHSKRAFVPPMSAVTRVKTEEDAIPAALGVCVEPGGSLRAGRWHAQKAC
jgi:hypothetical protein